MFAKFRRIRRGPRPARGGETGQMANRLSYRPEVHLRYEQRNTAECRYRRDEERHPGKALISLFGIDICECPSFLQHRSTSYPRRYTAMGPLASAP